MRIRVKVRRNRRFKPVILWQLEMYWVEVFSGGYFHVIKNRDQTWSHMCNYHRRLPSMRSAIQEYLEIERDARKRQQQEYRRLRVNEKVFTT